MRRQVVLLFVIATILLSLFLGACASRDQSIAQSESSSISVSSNSPSLSPDPTINVSETQTPTNIAASEEIQSAISLGKMLVHFIDVGQGDSIHIQAGDHAMLIDAGENDKGSVVLSYLKDQGISKLDYVIATHPHSDHIGGLDTVLNAIPTDNVILPNVGNSTQSFEDFLDAVYKNNSKAIQPVVGISYSLGDAVFVRRCFFEANKKCTWDLGNKL